MLTKADIEKFFLAEKQTGLLILIIGAIALVLGVIFMLVFRTALFKGVAWPLLLIGGFELFVGFSIYKRADAERIRLVYSYDMNPSVLKQEELPRLQHATSQMNIYRMVELGLALLGLILMIYFRSEAERSFWVGLGLSLIIQCMIMFVIETGALNRAKEYTRKLSAYLAAWPQN